eukprot:10256329-Karenia_brevis.AAC.1
MVDLRETDFSQFSSHSCKSSLLTIASQYGMSRESRTALGYHVGKPMGQSVDVYARRRLEFPMGEL